MRVAAIYDIHANLPGLEAVLEDIRQAGADHVVVGGDVLPGPMPRETIQCLQNLKTYLGTDIPVQFIQGNGDREVLAQLRGTETDWYRTAREQWRAPVRWTAEQLRREDEEILASWPATCRVEIALEVKTPEGATAVTAGMNLRPANATLGIRAARPDPSRALHTARGVASRGRGKPRPYEGRSIEVDEGRALTAGNLRAAESPGFFSNVLGEVLFCHATPRSDAEIFTRLTSEDRLLPIFKGLDVSIVVCGHTHMQFDRMIGSIRVVNAGSVGMPFGEAGAYWLLLGPDVQLKHTRYDLAKAAERVQETKYPQAEDFAARNVVQPPSEKEMLEVFSRAELK